MSWSIRAGKNSDDDRNGNEYDEGVDDVTAPHSKKWLHGSTLGTVWCTFADLRLTFATRSWYHFDGSLPAIAA